MNKIFLLFFILISIRTSAQKIYGTVFNAKGDLLPYSSITIKGTTMGASANNRAKFVLNVTGGAYTVICQHIGYTTEEKSVTITHTDQELAFVLKEQKLVMKETKSAAPLRGAARSFSPSRWWGTSRPLKNLM